MSNHRRVVAALLILLGITACATDPLAGLSAASGASAPLNARVPPLQGPVALVPSRNVETFLTSNSGADADYAVTAAIVMFRALYPGMAIMPNLAEARTGGMDRTIVLDVQGGARSAAIQAVVLDRGMAPISRIEAQGSDSEGQARRSYDRALVQLQARMREVFP